MATTNRYDGGSRFNDVETGAIEFAIGESTLELPTGLSRVLSAYFVPATGTATYSTARDIPVINEALTGTATGASAGVAISGTGFTIALPSTNAAARTYLYRLEGVS